MEKHLVKFFHISIIYNKFIFNKQIMKNLLNYLDDYFDENLEENISHRKIKKNKFTITEEKLSHKYKEDKNKDKESKNKE